MSYESSFQRLTRRAMLGQSAAGIGSVALAAMLAGDVGGAGQGGANSSTLKRYGGLNALPHFEQGSHQRRAGTSVGQGDAGDGKGAVPVSRFQRQPGVG